MIPVGGPRNIQKTRKEKCKENIARILYIVRYIIIDIITQLWGLIMSIRRYIIIYLYESTVYQRIKQEILDIGKFLKYKMGFGEKKPFSKRRTAELEDKIKKEFKKNPTTFLKKWLKPSEILIYNDPNGCSEDCHVPVYEWDSSL